MTTDALIGALVEGGLTHVVGLPDTTLGPLFDRISATSALQLVRVAREGEAFAVGSGLWLGGRRAAVAIQNTGLLESGDALRGTASRMGVPLLFFVSYRGFAKSLAAGLEPPPTSPLPEHLVRSDVDSVAVMTEATLDAWGIPHHRISSTHDGGIAQALRTAETERRPYAILLNQKFG